MRDDDHFLSHSVVFNIHLRNFVLANSPDVVWLFTDDADALLARFWNRTAAGIDEPHRRPAAGLTGLSIHRVENHLTRVIAFPPPERMTENYFIAIACPPENERGDSPERPPPTPRYFTLEMGHESRKTGTVLAEWTPHAHLNYGEGPEPKESAFLACVARLLSGDVKVDAAFMRPTPPTLPRDETRH
ncbi:MAG: hypothetical protein ACKVU1_03085 [bacterium]